MPPGGHLGGSATSQSTRPQPESRCLCPPLCFGGAFGVETHAIQEPSPIRPGIHRSISPNDIVRVADENASGRPGRHSLALPALEDRTSSPRHLNGARGTLQVPHRCHSPSHSRDRLLLVFFPSTGLLSWGKSKIKQPLPSHIERVSLMHIIRPHVLNVRFTGQDCPIFHVDRSEWRPRRYFAAHRIVVLPQALQVR